MTWFDRIKGFYDTRRWPKAWVWDTVNIRITETEYETITGERYTTVRPV